MGALGQMTISIVHDFNNLLTVIDGGSEIALRNMDQDNPCCESLKGVHAACDRAISLTRRLLAFSRQEKPQTVDVFPNKAVEDIKRILDHLLRPNIRLTTALQPDLPSVRADPGQFEQALINLAVNARDAMPDGGKLTITTSLTRLKPPNDHDAGDNTVHQDYVTVAVTDTGIGMSEETKHRLFEPFFTTKERGRGTGLGLAMVRDFARQNGGFVKVQSKPNEGAAFTLYLPASPAPRHESVPGCMRGARNCATVQGAG
jgi:hypothetical protein